MLYWMTFIQVLILNLMRINSAARDQEMRLLEIFKEMQTGAKPGQAIKDVLKNLVPFASFIAAYF